MLLPTLIVYTLGTILIFCARPKNAVQGRALHACMLYTLLSYSPHIPSCVTGCIKEKLIEFWSALTRSFEEKYIEQIRIK